MIIIIIIVNSYLNTSHRSWIRRTKSVQRTIPLILFHTIVCRRRTSYTAPKTVKVLDVFHMCDFLLTHWTTAAKHIEYRSMGDNIENNKKEYIWYTCVCQSWYINWDYSAMRYFYFKLSKGNQSVRLRCICKAIKTTVASTETPLGGAVDDCALQFLLVPPMGAFMVALQWITIADSTGKFAWNDNTKSPSKHPVSWKASIKSRHVWLQLRLQL